jgi:hypothetical protein
MAWRALADSALLRRASQSPYVMPARAVIGRDEELAAIEAFLAEVHRRLLRIPRPVTPPRRHPLHPLHPL